jgi:4-hydroxy-tetrahydrodipicolinate reductase
MNRLRVAVLGASGKLGSFACEYLERSAEFEIVSRAGEGDDVRAVLGSTQADVVFEATAAGLGARHARWALESGARPLVATSGVGPDEVAELDGLARELGLGGLYAPNLSRGMWLLQRMVEDAARHIPSCEIVELHHDRKRDAPSGTAIDTARRIRAVRAESDPASGGDVPIHSVRLPGLRAHQEVVFGAPGELLTLRHDALSAEAYGPGVHAGLMFVARARGFAIGIGHAFAADPS